MTVGPIDPPPGTKMAGQSPAKPAPHTSASIVQKFSRALGLHSEGDRIFARDPVDRLVYITTFTFACVLTLPFILIPVDGVSAGLAGLPSPGIWDNVGRAQSLARGDFWPIAPGNGPSSPLWTWILSIAFAPFGWTGLSIAIIARFFSFLAGMLAILAFYNLALSATGHRWPGILAITLILLDPVIAYGRVSGSESALFTALIVIACLALLHGRLALLRTLLVLIALSRADGAIFVAAIGVVLAAELLWRGGNLSSDIHHDLVSLTRVMAPAIAGLLVWSLYLLFAAGEATPRLWPGTDALGRQLGMQISATSLWNGLLGQHPSMASGFFVVSVATYVWTSWLLFRRWRIRGILPVLIPMMAILAVLPEVPPVAVINGNDARRLFEPALPWLSFSLAVALSAAGQFMWHRTRPGLGPRLAMLEHWPAARLLSVLPLVFWLLSASLGWIRLSNEYARGASAIADLPVAAGKWIAANTDTNARIGFVPGAEPARSSAKRDMRALPIAEPGRRRELSWSMAREYGLDYAIVFRGSNPPIRPTGVEVVRFSVSPRGGVLPSNELSIYRIDAELPQLDPVRPILMSTTGYTILDSIHIGEAESETQHFYSSATGVRGPGISGESNGPAGWIRDTGRLHEATRGAESFNLRARPGQDLLLGVRYDNLARGTLRVNIDEGAGEVVELRMRDCGAGLCEDVLIIPGSRISSPSIRVTVAFALLPDSPTTLVGTYRYWSMVRATQP